MTVNGTDDGFDGFRIGLAGFENPMRDPKTEEAKRLIGQVDLILTDYNLPYTYTITFRFLFILIFSKFFVYRDAKSKWTILAIYW